MPWKILVTKIVLFALFSPFFGYYFKRVSNNLEKALKQRHKTKVWLVMSSMMLMIAILERWLLEVTWMNIISLILFIPIFGYFAMLGAVGFKSPDKWSNSKTRE